MRDNFLMMQNPISKNPIINVIINRVVKRNQNFIVFVVGSTGSGKSYLSLALCEEISKILNISFKVENNVCFSNREFMRAIKDESNVQGTCYMYDEAGVGISSKEFWSVANRMISYLLQTFRRQNLITIFTVPQFGFIDKNSRLLAHCIIETTGIDYDKKICYFKAKFVNTNAMTNKMYPKHLRVRYKGKTITVNKLGIYPPSKDTIDDYEIKKLNFTTNLNKSIEIAIGVTEEDKFIQNLTPAQKEIYKLRVHRGLSIAQIAEVKGRNEAQIRRLITLIKNKGYPIT